MQRITALPLFLLALALWLAGCARSDRQANAPASTLDMPASATPAPGGILLTLDPDKQIAQSPGGEMVPGVVLPRPMVSTDPPLGTSRGELFAEASKALSEKRLDDAIAICDTLLVLHPADPELLELRAKTLEAKGAREDAAVDLQRCCQLGRAACCISRP